MSQGLFQDFGQGGKAGCNGIMGGGQSGMILLEANPHLTNCSLIRSRYIVKVWYCI